MPPGGASVRWESCSFPVKREGEEYNRYTHGAVRDVKIDCTDRCNYYERNPVARGKNGRVIGSNLSKTVNSFLSSTSVAQTLFAVSPLFAILSAPTAAIIDQP